MPEYICFNIMAEWPAGLPEMGEIRETLYIESKSLLGKPAEIMFYNWQTGQKTQYQYDNKYILRWPQSSNGDILFLYNTDNSNISFEALDRLCSISVSIERTRIQEMGLLATEQWIEVIMSNIFDRSHCVLIAGSELDISAETNNLSEIVYNAFNDLGTFWIVTGDQVVQSPSNQFVVARRFNKHVLLRNIRAEL